VAETGTSVGLPTENGVSGDGSLRAVLGARNVRLRERETLKQGVYRLLVEADGTPVRIVVKRVERSVAERVRRVLGHWLPAVGLSDGASPLLGVTSAAAGGRVWLVYRDLGGRSLGTDPPVKAEVAAALELVARLHRRFADHELLDECRRYGNDLGRGFYEASVRGALDALEAVAGSGPGSKAPASLLPRLKRLDAEASDRFALLEEWGGPATFLHGDLWTSNVVVLSGESGVRLVDWDQCGVGYASYDLSAFLLRFPRSQRRWILAAYEAATRDASWPVASRYVLNQAYDTAERARLANCALWAGRAVHEGHVEWGVGRLAEIDQWLEALEPVVPD
jgi:Phosphotransferase enzyme family